MQIRWLEVTLDKATNHKMWINMNHIVSVTENVTFSKRGTAITVSYGAVRIVEETPEELWEQLEVE